MVGIWKQLERGARAKLLDERFQKRQLRKLIASSLEEQHRNLHVEEMLRSASPPATAAMKGWVMPAPAPCASPQHARAPSGAWSRPETRCASLTRMVRGSGSAALIDLICSVYRARHFTDIPEIRFAGPVRPRALA